MKFHYRSFISYTLALSFIIITVSGLILYVTPHGRFAYWVNWSLLGLTKDDWSAVHTIVGYIFIVATFIHFIFNYRVFVNYLRNSFRKGILHTKELTASVAIIVLIAAATLTWIPPFSTIMIIGESFKESWGVGIDQSPVPHAELMTLEQFSEGLEIPVEFIIKTLNDYGIQVNDSNETLKSIADRNNISPSDVYKIIQPRRGEGRSIGFFRNPGSHRNRRR